MISVRAKDFSMSKRSNFKKDMDKKKHRTIEVKESRRSNQQTERKKKHKGRMVVDNFLSLESTRAGNPRHMSFLNMKNMTSQKFDFEE